MKRFNKKQLLVVTLIIALVSLFSVGITSFATTKNAGSSETAKAATKENTDSEKESNDNSDNKQTVYVMQETDGSEYQRIVSTNDSLKYEGYSGATMPVTMDITYSLNGEEMSAEEIAGEKGRVKIHISYTNHVQSNGVYTPFLCVTGMMFDDDDVSNITIDHGEITDDGSKVVILGYALPGLKESLGLNMDEIDGLDDLELPNEVTISFSTERFEMDEIYSMVTAEPFKDMDFDENSDINDLKSKIDDVRSAAKKLTKGTEELSDGADELAAGADKLSDASVTLKDSTKQVAQGTKKLNDKVPSLTSGMGQLAAGAQKIADGNQDLYTGLKTAYGNAPSEESEGSGTQLLAAGASSLSGGLGTLQESTSKLADGSAQISDGLTKLSGSSSDINQLAGAADTIAKTVQSNFKQFSEEDINAAWAAYDQLVKADASEEELQAVRTKIEQMNQSNGAYNAIAAFEENYGKYNVSASVAQYTGAVDTLAANAGTVTSGIKSVDTALEKQLVPGSESLESGVDSLNTALNEQLLPGAKSLAEGSEQLASSSGLLQSGSKTLAKGVKQLSDGSQKLYKGTKTFSEKEAELAKGAKTLAKGADTLDKSIDSAVKEGKKSLDKLDKSGMLNVVDNAKAISSAADSYQSFGGGGPYKSVTFIYKVDGVSSK